MVQAVLYMAVRCGISNLTKAALVWLEGFNARAIYKMG